MVRRVDAPESEPVAFLFRGKRHGYCSYSHLVGNPGKEEILAPADFKDWEVVEVAHPGYLEEYFKQACSSYNLTSFSPDERGESDIASHENGTARGFAVDARAAAGTLHGKLQTLFLCHDRRQQPLCQRDDYGTCTLQHGPQRKGLQQPRQERHGVTREMGENVHSKRFARLPKRPSPKNSVSRRSGRRSKPLSTMPPRPFTVSIRVRHEAIAGLSSSATSPGDSPPMSTMATWKSSTVPSLVCESGTTKSRNLSSRHAIQSSSIPNSSARCGKSSRNGQAVKIREIPFDGGKVVYNFEEDRLQILFDKIPDTDMRTTLKRNAFKWAPRNQAWQRQLTRNAEYAAGQVLKITI